MADQTKEVQKPVNEKLIKFRAAHKAAMLLVKECVDASKNEKYIAAMKVIKPSLYGGSPRAARVGGTSPITTFLKLIKEAGKAGVHEDIMFKQLKSGRRECRVFIKNGLRKAAPADRLWISFNEEKGIYTLVGTGANPPANWEGYVPVDTKVELK
jgi:hypothetical protein